MVVDIGSQIDTDQMSCACISKVARREPVSTSSSPADRIENRRCRPSQPPPPVDTRFHRRWRQGLLGALVRGLLIVELPGAPSTTRSRHHLLPLSILSILFHSPPIHPFVQLHFHCLLPDSYHLNFSHSLPAVPRIALLIISPSKRLAPPQVHGTTRLPPFRHRPRSHCHCDSTTESNTFRLGKISSYLRRLNVMR